MTYLSVFLLWLFNAPGVENPHTFEAQLQPVPPPGAESANDPDEEEIDWVEIHRRLIQNGRDGIFNGV